MRGEHLWVLRQPSTQVGSPPHARGTPNALTQTNFTSRITPACAGNTRQSNCFHFGNRDHPRMRGEHLSKKRTCDGHGGSPPHARGTPSCSCILLSVCRITPACAGNTVMGALTREDQQDHPRMRGEHFLKTLDSLP